MVLSIQITPETEARLRDQARAAGKEVPAYVAELMEQAAAKPALDQMLAALRKQFAASDISDAELIDDVTNAQAEHRAEKAVYH